MGLGLGWEEEVGQMGRGYRGRACPPVSPVVLSRAISAPALEAEGGLQQGTMGHMAQLRFALQCGQVWSQLLAQSSLPGQCVTWAGNSG